MSRSTIYEILQEARSNLRNAIVLRDWENVDMAEFEVNKAVKSLSEGKSLYDKIEM
jgi:hypothetical protein